jgi:hypothetical protein
MTATTPPPHYNHAISVGAGRLHCADCQVDVSERDVFAIERYERNEALEELSLARQAVADAARKLVEAGVLPEGFNVLGRGPTEGLAFLADTLIELDGRRKAAEAYAQKQKPFERQRRAERIYERLVSNTGLVDGPADARMKIIRDRALRAAAVWDGVE